MDVLEIDHLEGALAEVDGHAIAILDLRHAHFVALHRFSHLRRLFRERLGALGIEPFFHRGPGSLGIDHDRRRRKHPVAESVVVVNFGIEHKAHRFVGQLLDRRHQVVRVRRPLASIDDDRPFFGQYDAARGVALLRGININPVLHFGEAGPEILGLNRRRSHPYEQSDEKPAEPSCSHTRLLKNEILTCRKLMEIPRGRQETKGVNRTRERAGLRILVAMYEDRSELWPFKPAADHAPASLSLFLALLPILLRGNFSAMCSSKSMPRPRSWPARSVMLKPSAKRSSGARFFSFFSASKTG